MHKAPICANCGRDYQWHKWRSDKGACNTPPPGKKTYYRVPDKVEPQNDPKPGGAVA